jgi:hypothetical protein
MCAVVQVEQIVATSYAVGAVAVVAVSGLLNLLLTKFANAAVMAGA